jgi:hypothetical protein
MRESRGASTTAVSGSTLEGFWLSRWKYGSEQCRELLHIEKIDGTGRVTGRRVSIMPKHRYSYDVTGIYYSNHLHLSAIPSNHKALISVCLVLKLENHFLDNLTGIAIRPMGRGALPKFEQPVLRYKSDLWASLVEFTRVIDVKKEDAKLWSSYKESWPDR